MLNFVGACIVTAFLVNLLIKRPSLKVGEDNFRSAPQIMHYIILITLILLALQESLHLFDAIEIISMPNTLLSFLFIWVHEAGHVYFNWGWDVLHAFGGTLNEIIFPLLPAYYCYIKKYKFLCSLFIFWLGHNFFGIGVYMADSRARKEIMFGDGSEIHDWEFLLNKFNIINYDVTLGNTVWAIGWIFVALSIIIYIMEFINISQHKRQLG
jgi:hypothetical protein